MKKRTLPYGYIIRNGEIIIDRNAEKIITEIFQAYLDGMSFGKIADEMTYRGIDYYDGKTLKSIADDFGMSYINIKIMHKKALNFLKTKLKQG